MDGPPAQEANPQLEELTLAIEDLRRRVAALEGRSMPAEAIATPHRELPIAEPAAPPEVPAGLLAALGRALLGIAGAYLLRAITEAGVVPPTAGVFLGLAYAAAWLASSMRISAANRLMIASQGFTACLIAAPLLWESAVRFHTMQPAIAAAALAAWMLLGQALAWRPGFSILAGVTAVCGSATSLALIVGTLDPAPFAIALAVAAVATELGAIFDRALNFRWIVALAADSTALLLAYLITRPQGLPEGYGAVPLQAVIWIQISLVAIYVASLAARTALRRSAMEWFEIVQISVVAVLAVETGLRAAHAQGVVGLILLAAGAACYLAAFAGPGRRNVVDYHVYATYAVVLAALGSLLRLPPPFLTAAWLLAGLAAMWLGERGNRNTLRLHGAAYLVAAAVESGLLASTAERFLGVSSHTVRPIGATAVWCFGAIAVGYALTILPWRAVAKPWNTRLGAAALAASICWTASGLMAGWMVGNRLDASTGSTVRTALVAIVALALAWLGRRFPLRELAWILYPWMAFGALKLFADDFRQGRPLTLFLSLLFYGATLIALPRLRRQSKPPAHKSRSSWTPSTPDAS